MQRVEDLATETLFNEVRDLVYNNMLNRISKYWNCYHYSTAIIGRIIIPACVNESFFITIFPQLVLLRGKTIGQKKIPSNISLNFDCRAASKLTL